MTPTTHLKEGSDFYSYHIFKCPASKTIWAKQIDNKVLLIWREKEQSTGSTLEEAQMLDLIDEDF
jgi:hypothetical protein